MDLTVLYALGIALIITGIVIVVAVIIIASRGGAENGHGRVKGAGVIVIGPIPIIFGTDKKSVKAALALALTIVILIVFLLNWFLR